MNAGGLTAGGRSCGRESLFRATAARGGAVLAVLAWLTINADADGVAVMSVSGIARSLRITDDVVRGHLDALTASGLIQRNGSPRGTVFRLFPEPEQNPEQNPERKEKETQGLE